MNFIVQKISNDWKYQQNERFQKSNIIDVGNLYFFRKIESSLRKIEFVIKPKESIFKNKINLLYTIMIFSTMGKYSYVCINEFVHISKFVFEFIFPMDSWKSNFQLYLFIRNSHETN